MARSVRPPPSKYLADRVHPTASWAPWLPALTPGPERSQTPRETSANVHVSWRDLLNARRRLSTPNFQLPRKHAALGVGSWRFGVDASFSILLDSLQLADDAMRIPESQQLLIVGRRYLNLKLLERRLGRAAVEARHRDADVIDCWLVTRDRLQAKSCSADLEPHPLRLVFRPLTLIAEERAVERRRLFQIGHAQRDVVDPHRVHRRRIERHPSAWNDRSGQPAWNAEQLQSQTIGIADHADTC